MKEDRHVDVLVRYGLAYKLKVRVTSPRTIYIPSLFLARVSYSSRHIAQPSRTRLVFMWR